MGKESCYKSKSILEDSTGIKMAYQGGGMPHYLYKFYMGGEE